MRRSCRSAGSWPAVAYQQVAMAWQASWNGMVRSTARAVRLRACPAPKTWRASSIATSMLHLAAYRSITWAGVAVVSVVTRARSYPAVNRSRMSTTVTALVPKTEGQRQVRAAAEMSAALPYRVTVTLVNAVVAASPARAGSRSPLVRGRPRRPVRAGGSWCRAASLRSRVVQVTWGGSFFSSPPA